MLRSCHAYVYRLVLIAQAVYFLERKQTLLNALPHDSGYTAGVLTSSTAGGGIRELFSSRFD